MVYMEVYTPRSPILKCSSHLAMYLNESLLHKSEDGSCLFDIEEKGDKSK